jgi:predicted enzyme related to lactoylglutathione lyase
MLSNSHAFSGFSVSDIAGAKKFYSEVLGLDIEDGPMGFGIRFANGGKAFIYAKENHIPATFTILNFPVDDIDACVDELTSKGVKFEVYEGMHQDEKGIARGIAANMGPDIAWFKDPAGNILSVLNDGKTAA